MNDSRHGTSAAARIVPDVSVRQDMFELLRRLDRAAPALPRLGRRPDIDAGRLAIRQHADPSFATREVAAMAQHDVGGVTRLTVETRHWGMFAPYGPMPMALTEAARGQVSAGSDTIQALANVLVGRPAVCFYRAWSQLNPVVAAERDDDAFSLHVAQLAGAKLRKEEDASTRLRMCFPGAYRRYARSLGVLARLLGQSFGVPVTVTGRHPGWCDMPVSARACLGGTLGRMRLGRRFYDRQHRALVQIGPLGNPAYLQWRNDAPRLRQFKQVIDDFVGHGIDVIVHRVVELHPGMAMRLGAAHVGHSAWLAPRGGTHARTMAPRQLPAKESTC
jgi:type VI secretion system protein ImpH